MTEWHLDKIRSGEYSIIDPKSVGIEFLEKCPECSSELITVKHVISNGAIQYKQICWSNDCGWISPPIAHSGRKNHSFRREDQDWWKKEIFNYYNGRCAICGSNDRCEAHHIIPYSVAPLWIRDRLQNGILLCKSCHDMAHGKKPSQKKERRDLDKGDIRLEELFGEKITF